MLQRANGSSIPHDAAPLGHPQLPGLVAQLSTVQHNSEGIESTSGLETSTMPQAGDTPLAAQSAEMGAPISPTIDCQAVTSQSGASTAVHLPGTMLPPAYAGGPSFHRFQLHFSSKFCECQGDADDDDAYA